MLRLTGLPPPDRCPDVAVRRRGDGLELRFHGSGTTQTIDVPGWTLEGEDLESVQLRLLAELGRRGYRASLER